MTEGSDALEMAYLQEDRIERILTDEPDPVALESSWRFWARPEQILPPPADWPGTTAYGRGGRGSGKSWFAVENFADLILTSDPGEWACVSPTFGDARAKQIESSESGLIMALGGKCSPTGLLIEKGPEILQWNRSVGHLSLRNGSMVYCDGADDGALRIQGFNLRGVWADEVGMWRQWETAWDESIAYAVRLDPAVIIASGTPKRSMPARTLVRRLADDPKVINRIFRTLDNSANLSPKRLAELVDKHRGTRLGRQELDGEILEDGGGFLRREWFTGNPDPRATDGPFVLDEVPPGHDRRVRMWDLAATEPSDGNQDPDFTAGALVSYSPETRLWLIEHVDRFRLSPGARDDRIRKRAQEDRIQEVWAEQEPGSSGKSVIESLDKLIGLDGRVMRPYLPTGRKGVRAQIIATVAERGKDRKDPRKGPGFALLRGSWDVEAFLREAEDFDPDDDTVYPHDDQVDAVSAGMAVLSTDPPARGMGVAQRRLPQQGPRRSPRGAGMVRSKWS